MEEIPRLVIAASDRVMSRGLGEEGSPASDSWELSSPVSGVRILGTWQVYHNVWLTLSLSEDGHYNIYRSVGIQSPALVHEHDCEIYGIFYIDDGIALLSAADGWWVTLDTGGTWIQLWYGDDSPEASALARIDLEGLGRWGLIAYGRDRRIYYCDFIVSEVTVPDMGGAVPEYDSWEDLPITSETSDLDLDVSEYDSWDDVPAFADSEVSGEWLEIYDIAMDYEGIVPEIDEAVSEPDEAVPEYDSWGSVPDILEPYFEKWYPAIAGGPAGVLVGAGSRLLRTVNLGESWQTVQEFSNLAVKSIIASNQSLTPVFLNILESLLGEPDKLYWTYDLGDSVVPELNRIGAVASAQSVMPTGTNEVSTSFAVLGRRTEDAATMQYKILEG